MTLEKKMPSILRDDFFFFFCAFLFSFLAFFFFFPFPCVPYFFFSCPRLLPLALACVCTYVLCIVCLLAIIITIISHSIQLIWPRLRQMLSRSSKFVSGVFWSFGSLSEPSSTDLERRARIKDYDVSPVGYFSSVFFLFFFISLKGPLGHFVLLFPLKETETEGV